MIITADSGSTSIDWRILRRGEPVRRLASPGVNPVLQGVEAIRGVFAEALRGVEGPGIRVYFYGAGVVSEAAGEKVREALRAVLPGCEVTAGSDLEAAAIALLGDKDGVAAILGTGSNSGLYLGGRIVRNIPAGGFILGDEGSGAWLGKMLLADYIKGLLPQDVETALREEFPGLDYPAVVSRVYGGEMPSRYLASGGGQPGLRWGDALAVSGFVLPFLRAAEGLSLCPKPGGKWVPPFPGSQCVALRPS